MPACSIVDFSNSKVWTVVERLSPPCVSRVPSRCPSSAGIDEAHLGAGVTQCQVIPFAVIL